MTVYASTGGGLPLPVIDNVSRSHQLRPAPASAHRILFIEPPTPDSASLKTQIERATLWRVMQTADIIAGLEYLLGQREKVTIVAFGLNHERHRALRFLQTINKLAA